VAIKNTGNGEAKEKKKISLLHTSSSGNSGPARKTGMVQKSKARVNLQALATGKKSGGGSGSGKQDIPVIREDEGDEEDGEGEEVGSLEEKADIERVSSSNLSIQVKADA
jgi:hypothetical protein